MTNKIPSKILFIRTLTFVVLFIAMLCSITLSAQESTNKLIPSLGWIFKTNEPLEVEIVNSLNLKCICKGLNIYSSKSADFPDEIKQKIVYIQKDRFVTYRNTTPNDNDFDLQWYLDKIQAPKAWDYTTGGLTYSGKEIVIGIIDSGFDLAHEDLKSIFWHNTNEIPDDNIDNDHNGYYDDYTGVNIANADGTHPIDYHGTGVLGLCAASGNNNVGISGVNWNVKVVPISGASRESEIIEAYDYLRNLRQIYNETNGAEGALVVVTNASFGIDYAKAEDFPLWCEMYDYLGELGILSVAATTNSQINVDEDGDMPTSCTSNFLITVTNSDKLDKLDTPTGYGLVSIDLASPGDEIYTTYPNNGYRSFSGTSAATPIVTGAVALLYTLPSEVLEQKMFNEPTQLALAIKAKILASVSQNLSLQGKCVSGGRLNIADAMDSLRFYVGGTIGNLSITKLYPNPTTSDINIEYETPNFDEYEIVVTNILGEIEFVKKVIPPKFEQKETNIVVSDLVEGIHFVTIRNKKETASSKFFKY